MNIKIHQKSLGNEHPTPGAETLAMPCWTRPQGTQNTPRHYCSREPASVRSQLGGSCVSARAWEGSGVDQSARTPSVGDEPGRDCISSARGTWRWGKKSSGRSCPLSHSREGRSQGAAPPSARYRDPKSLRSHNSCPCFIAGLLALILSKRFPAVQALLSTKKTSPSPAGTVLTAIQRKRSAGSSEETRDAFCCEMLASVCEGQDGDCDL